MIQLFENNNIAFLCKNINEMEILFNLLQENNIKHGFREQYQTFENIHKTLLESKHYNLNEPIFFMVGKFMYTFAYKLLEKCEDGNWYYWYYFRNERDKNHYNDWKDWQIMNLHKLRRENKLERILNE